MFKTEHTFHYGNKITNKIPPSRKIEWYFYTHFKKRREKDGTKRHSNNDEQRGLQREI